MAMSRVLASATLALLIATAAPTVKAWGNKAAVLRLSQAAAEGDEVLDAEKVKHLDAEAMRFFEAGDYAQAISITQHSLKWREANVGTDHPDTASNLNNLALLFKLQGFYARAESLYQRALTILEKRLGLDHPDTALALNNLAVLYRDQGLYSKAELLFERTLAIRNRALGRSHRDTATSLSNLASLYYLQGLYKKAESLFTSALAITEKALGPNHPDNTAILHNFASLHQRLRNFDRAESLLQRSQAIVERSLSADHSRAAIIMASLAYLYHEQGFYSKAEPLYLRSLAIQEKAFGAEHPYIATVLLNLGVLYRELGDINKAAPFLQRALAIRAKTLGGDHPDTAVSTGSLALLFENQRMFSKAEQLWRLTFSAENKIIQREASLLPRLEREAFVRTRFGFAYQILFSSAHRGPSGANLALFARLNRHGLLEEIEKRQALLAYLPGGHKELLLELRTANQQLGSATLTRDQRQLLKLRQAELERGLYRLLPELKPRTVEVSQVASVLPEGSALVEFQRYGPYGGNPPAMQMWQSRYLALVLKPNGSISSIDLGQATPIEKVIQNALTASEQKLGDAQQLWAQVGRFVLGPLASATRGVNTLFISPDGELNRVPFAALPAPGSSQLLSEALKLRMLTTGRELLDLQNAPSTKTSQALVVANPAFDRRPVSVQSPRPATSSQQRSGELGSRRWAPLPGTATEGAAIAQLTGGRLLAGEQASAAAIQQQQTPRLLHLATHAYFQPDLPDTEREEDRAQRSNNQGPTALSGENPLLRSGVVLAGANQPDADPADDGYLTALEVARLNWKGTEMVVISACESGKGDIQAGEGVYGLKRAIAVAGARSSLLSLWKVDDRATAAFMESFYNKLKAGMGRADALATTQKEFRESGNSTWSHPYVWAAFQLSGDWGPVRW